jgi:hypothetical protein
MHLHHACHIMRVYNLSTQYLLGFIVLIAVRQVYLLFPSVKKNTGEHVTVTYRN